ncbi:exosome complex exonuclease rrp [Ophiostoma piceae UAMH 11346]|uniref:Exosome complex exonuclease rrp n=1 Tax=Ophiostoma piceae (strain UAMH 11346) TaxID=1262450 RepID=S3BV97_OPHP1|nr:exosome complex exonuclease rrp [Ophiostoma piceae UAMH 11346]
MDSDDFKAQQQKIQAALVAVNRTVNGIAAEDLTFLRTVNPDVASEIDVQAARLLRLSNSLIKSAANATGRKDVPTLEDADDVELNWRGVVDVIDALLEKADTTLDEYTGLLKRKDAPTTEGGPDSKKAKPTERLDWSLRRANIPKPQELFERKPDNFDMGPWKPLLTKKPHATYVSLEDSFTTFVDEYDHTQYKHPYETEITRLQYPAHVYQKAEPIPFLPVDTTEAVWVDTFEGVEAMLEELRDANVIAVDLEHHDFRTYTGLLSLMQISTRTKDWVIDTLQPWRHKLEILNEVFADPTKLKVFHGASSDIVWLQRDLGLYIVGLFDTYFACDCLEYGKRSLAFLLERFVNFDADKKYQMADWRIRPLSDEMLYYARSDTHYLLYIFDMVRNELAEKSDRSNSEKDLTEYVLKKSKEVSLSRHEAQFCDSETGQGTRGWLNNLVKTYTLLSGEQFAVYRALYEWRDNISRRLDESTGYIMPNRVLSDVARILPPDQKALLSLLGNNTARATKASLGELFTLIQEAKERGASGPTSIEFLRSDKISALTKASASHRHHNNFSASATASQLKVGGVATKDLTPLPDITDLRSNFSQLWGSTAISTGKSRGGEETGGALIEAPWYVQAAIAGPAPAVSADATAAATPSAAKMRPNEDYEYIEFPSSAQKTQPPASQLAPTDSEEAEEGAKKEPVVEEVAKEPEGAFTLKWGKKDVKEAKEGKKMAKDDRKAAKLARKAAKQFKRAAESTSEAASASEAASGGAQTSDSDGGAPINAGDDEELDDDYVPFNYDTAGSVLHAKKGQQNDQAQQKRKGKKVFNPYGGNPDAKGDDGPKPARRMHFEKLGKGGTFKK